MNARGPQHLLAGGITVTYGPLAVPIRSAEASTTTRSAPPARRAMACPTRPQPHRIMWPRMAPIRRSILRLPKVPSRYPSTRVPMATPKV